jgi:hypothetical protein
MTILEEAGVRLVAAVNISDDHISERWGREEGPDERGAAGPRERHSIRRGRGAGKGGPSAVRGCLSSWSPDCGESIRRLRAPRAATRGSRPRRLEVSLAQGITGSERHGSRPGRCWGGLEEAASLTQPSSGEGAGGGSVTDAAVERGRGWRRPRIESAAARGTARGLGDWLGCTPLCCSSRHAEL